VVDPPEDDEDRRHHRQQAREWVRPQTRHQLHRVIISWWYHGRDARVQVLFAPLTQEVLTRSFSQSLVEDSLRVRECRLMS
jgi:hypothetical protein